MKKPQRLRPGDQVAIVSLSRGMLGEEAFIHKFHLAKARLENDYGLRVVAMPNALKGIDYLYRHPEARAQDLMDAFRDPEIRAVFCAIGGDDTIRLLPYIDFDVLRNNPKIFTGFSDTTTNHFMMYKAGLVSYYGLSVMCDIAEYVEMNEYTRAAMENMLFHPTAPLDIPCSDFYGDDTTKIRWKEENMQLRRPRFPNTGYEILQGSGKVSGPLLGGCIDVFPEIVGTAVWPGLDEWRGKLLFLETSEDDPEPVELSWFLRNLAAQGIFDVIHGILVGKPALPDKYEPYKDIYRQVVGFEAGHPELPILYNVNVGHAYPIGLFGIGLEYEIDCERKTLTLLEPGTVEVPHMKALHCRPMTETDIAPCARLYMDYYNTAEGGQWTAQTACKRIHQVWSHEDALCLLFKLQGEVIGFAMGHFEQYDDLSAYDLVEIVIAAPWQNQGLGTACMALLEEEVRARGGAMVQLEAVNDAHHQHFYSKLGYQTCTNLVLKSKFL